MSCLVRSLILVIALSFVAQHAMAQSPTARGWTAYHPYELAGTFSHMLTDGSYGLADSTLNGWTASGSANIFSFAQATAEVGRYSRNKVSFTSFLAGPQLAFHVYRFQPFVRGLFGISHTKEGAASTTGFTLATGGGLDFPLSERIAVRALQVDYFQPHGTFYNAADFLRIGFGISYQFGTR
ncbi:MAG: hypothetical protein JO356_00725 [Acidobacteria bacterium]|nr:hypothetical protein [Acidobacteriota bacterium]